MRCARARRLIPEGRLGTLPDRIESALRDHLASCDDCSREARFDASLAALGTELRGVAAPGVDVAARVMVEVRDAAPARAEVPLGALGLAAVSAAAVAGAFLAATFLALPPAGETAVAARAALGSILDLKGLLLSALSVAGTFLRVALEAGADLVVAAAPMAQATALVALGVIGTITTVLLGRELRAAPVVKER